VCPTYDNKHPHDDPGTPKLTAMDFYVAPEGTVPVGASGVLDPSTHCGGDRGREGASSGTTRSDEF
jgi:hypothetical protein